MPDFKSTQDGSYSFTSVPMPGSDHISIKAIRDDNPMNGVSTFDLVDTKHILVLKHWKSPYKMIAADVDNNNDITVRFIGVA